MSRFLGLALFTVLLIFDLHAEEKEQNAPTALNFKLQSLDGKQVDLAKRYRGKVLLIVNVASQCGLTPQYERMQALHARYASKGLAVLGFPCNQFGAQEPGSSAEIKQFCQQNYGVTFDMFAKVDVNGDNACGLFKHLTSAQTKPKRPGEVGWNFEKFLIDRSGKVVGRFDPDVEPDDPAILEVIQKSLITK